MSSDNIFPIIDDEILPLTELGLNFDLEQDKREFYDFYSIGEVIGIGTSKVHFCSHLETNLEYAVKIVEKNNNATDGGGDLLAECRILQNLRTHDSIIYLHDTFISVNQIFLVFELAPYGELFDLLSEIVFTSEDVARQFMKQILDGVNFLHDNNVIHRDLKLENILLMDESDTIKISDFGFAVQVKPKTVLKELCGTPGYLSPEMIKASISTHEIEKGYSYPVDMWACGVILYTLLVGFPPFWHSNRMVLMRQIMKGKLQFLSPYWDSISEEAIDFVKQLLEVNSEKRLTAKDALKHPWMKPVSGTSVTTDTNDSLVKEEKEVDVDVNTSKNRKFKAAIHAVIAIKRMTYKTNQRKHYISSETSDLADKENNNNTNQPIVYEAITDDVYKDPKLRKLVDECAFRIYGHWVKRSFDSQNRAAMFENYLPIKS